MCPLGARLCIDVLVRMEDVSDSGIVARSESFVTGLPGRWTGARTLFAGAAVVSLPMLLMALGGGTLLGDVGGVRGTLRDPGGGWYSLESSEIVLRAGFGDTEDSSPSLALPS